MNKCIFTNIDVKRDVILEKNEHLRVGNKTEFSDFKILTGKGQLATEIFKINALEIYFKGKVQRKDYATFKEAVCKLIKTNVGIYGDEYLTNISLAEQQLLKGLNENFEISNLDIILFDATKSVEGEFEVKSLFNKENKKEIVFLKSVNEERFYFDVNEKNKTI